jgi:hypothetical protein
VLLSGSKFGTPPLVEDIVFNPYDAEYQKHAFENISLKLIQVTVLYKQSTVISIENLRVGGSIPPPGTTFQRNINDLNFESVTY